jgi:histidine kinase
LSISYGIVKECGGTIEARPKEPHGTCFVLRFPVADEAAGKNGTINSGRKASHA